MSANFWARVNFFILDSSICAVDLVALGKDARSLTGLLDLVYFAPRVAPLCSTTRRVTSVVQPVYIVPSMHSTR